MLSQALGKEDSFRFDAPPSPGAPTTKPDEIPKPQMPDQPTQEIADDSPKREPPVAAQPPPMPQAGQQGRAKLRPSKVQELLLDGLRHMPDFPGRGVSVTVYGSNPWNAMLNFAPGSTSHRNAIVLREALSDIVQKLRATIEVDIDQGN
jgi:hypothetical protein